jgi:hypothetical protein
MGAKLVEAFSRAAQEFGIPGRMKLAMLTKMSSGLAQTEPDSPQNIKMFEEALQQLRKQSK